jgi:methionyl-tRNA formyltransferase
MRIIVNGQQAFGKAVLERLLERGEEVVGVYCGPDKEGRPEDPIKTTAFQFFSRARSASPKCGSKCVNWPRTLA